MELNYGTRLCFCDTFWGRTEEWYKLCILMIITKSHVNLESMEKV